MEEKKKISKEYFEAYARISLERLKERDPRLASLIQGILRENYALRGKLNELLEETVRLREENASLRTRVNTLENAIEYWRANYENLNIQFDKLSREYTSLKADYNRVIMLKGVTELTYQSVVSAMQRLLNTIDEIFSKPSYILGEERTKELLRELRAEIISIMQSVKAKKEAVEATPTTEEIGT